MNRSKTVKLILLATIGILIFSFIPVVNAGEPPFITWEAIGDQYIGHGLWSPYWEVDGSEESYYRMGWGIAIPIELDEGWNSRPPFELKLFIDGIQVKLQRFHFYIKNIEDVHPVTEEPIMYDLHMWVWYDVFKPNYFTEGEHTIRSETWIKKSYGTDPRDAGWRIYINYEGPESWYGDQWPDPNSVYCFTHTLNVLYTE